MTTPACLRDDATAVVRRLRAGGHVAYFAGGCVRDLLLGREPKDFDVATNAPPAVVRQLFSNTQAVGAAFGVVLVRHGRSTIEVATFRSDGDYHDGRRPDSVTFTTPEHDAARRDFTVNGLFLDPVDDRVIDFVGGRADLDAKVIRAIGDPDTRLAEDHLRLLRAVRFAGRLGFEIDPPTAAAIRRHARQLPRIAPERIGDELRRILAGPTRGYRLLWELDLAGQVFRFLPAGDHFTAGESTTELCDHLDQMSLASAALDYVWLSDGKPADVGPILSKPSVGKIVRGLRQGLKITNDESTAVEGTLLGAGSMLVDPPAGVAKLKRFLATPTAPAARRLLAALAEIGVSTDRVRSLEPVLTELSRSDVAPPPLVTGDDLTARGAVPGPRFKIALDSAYDAQLEGRVTTADQAVRLAMSILAEAGRVE